MTYIYDGWEEDARIIECAGGNGVFEGLGMLGRKRRGPFVGTHASQAGGVRRGPQPLRPARAGRIEDSAWLLTAPRDSVCCAPASEAGGRGFRLLGSPRHPARPRAMVVSRSSGKDCTRKPHAHTGKTRRCFDPHLYRHLPAPSYPHLPACFNPHLPAPIY